MQESWEEGGSTHLSSLKIKLMIEAYLGISEEKESGSFEELLRDFSGIGGSL